MKLSWTMAKRAAAGVAFLSAAAAGVAMLAAWGAPGHRTIARLAIKMLPADVPAWVRDADVAAYQANEPDHWRSTKLPALTHENDPDHYIDAEFLADHKLTLKTLPRLRYEFVAALVKTTPETPAKPDGQPERRGVVGFDSAKVGFVPYAIAEHYAKLVSSMSTARIIEKLADPSRDAQLRAARANVLHEMGQLAHFVGDAAQPLHTTIHHHGWIGENPKGYTTDRNIHRMIDGDILALHGITPDVVENVKKPIADIKPAETWEAGIALIERSFAAVEPLYELEKSGELKKDKGKQFIAERLADGASVLGGLYLAAWKASEPTKAQFDEFVKYDEHQAEDGWSTRAPESKP